MIRHGDPKNKIIVAKKILIRFLFADLPSLLLPHPVVDFPSRDIARFPAPWRPLFHGTLALRSSFR
jgi:hypothetical protein